VRLRDLAFKGYDTVYLVSPLEESVLRALPAAAQQMAIREGMRPRRRPPRPGALPEAASDSDLIAAARRDGRPFAVAIAGDRAAVLLPHERADGVEGTRMLAATLSLAAGEPFAAAERSIPAPLLRALRAGGWSAVRSYIGGRSERRGIAVPIGPVRPAPGAFTRLVLDRSAVADIRRTASVGGRATLMSRVASIVLSALATGADPALDVRVVVPVDLRHLVGGRRVAGNFVSAETYGTLRTTDWSPASLNRLLATRRSTAAVALLAATVRVLLRFRGSAPAAPTVSVSLMGSVDLPDAAWARQPASMGCATVGRSPGVFVFVAQIGDVVTVSVWDDTGLFALDRFVDEFHAEVQRRTPVL
jgi:hypothetical protein